MSEDAAAGPAEERREQQSAPSEPKDAGKARSGKDGQDGKDVKVPGVGDGGAGEDSARKPADLGRKVSARASEPGRVGERQRAEDDALSAFERATIKARTFVGRDSYTIVTGERETAVPVPLDEEEIAETAETFVPPGGFDELVAQVADRPVVILRGNPGLGKYAAARRLLMDCAALYWVNPATTPAVLADAKLKAGGYIMDGLPLATAQRLTAADVRRLAGAFKECGGRLVVTVTGGARFTDPELHAHVVDLRAAPDVRKVLERHLAWRAGDRPVGPLLDDPHVAGFVDETLAGEVRPAQAALLAKLLIEAKASGKALVEAMRTALAARSRDRFESWFTGLPDLPTQAMGVAIAVLGGEPYVTVAEMALLLQRRLEPERPHADGERRRADPLAAQRSTRLRVLDAHVTPSNVPSRYGGTPGQVVRYRDPDMPSRVLLYFWEEYDEARPELLEWLRICAGHELQTVRARAAVATGVLTARAFDHVLELVIRPWAADEDPWLRGAAATALRVAAEAPGLRDAVRDLVRAWSLTDDVPEAQATAARCWQVEYDAAGRNDAFALLHELSTVDDVDVTGAICDSISEMLEKHGRVLAGPALTTLAAWVADRRAARRVTGRLAFLLAAADLVLDAPGADGRPVKWPTLLHLAAVDPELQRVVASLWRDTLCDSDLHRVAKSVLAEWVHDVDEHETARRSLVRLLLDVATTDRVTGIVRIEARGWATGPRGAPRTSREVLRALPEERSVR